ncbi:FAD-dependent oxidoreductase [Nafulsella turpanensis]|uniref:FAD-dependent oxidoreductase n=1 Tax=Nafulsella turpanensis TaxID=1265690 RepID=UPI00034D8E3D|nr:FAD-dependent oxidoreductase [Nafulsella turpanensis]
MATNHYYTQAIWSATTSPQKYPPLTEDIEVDVAIVGGGITGLTTAYNLTKAGKRVAILEKREIGMGTTGSSTGNLYGPTGEGLAKIASKHDEETMKSVVASRLAAVDFIERLVKEHSIDCEFKRVPWYYFTTPESSSKSKQVENELEAAKKTNMEVSGKAPAGFPFQVDSILEVKNQAQFDPLRYVQALATAISGPDCRIFEKTKVEHVEEGTPCTVHTSGGKVKAKKVVKATHSPLGIYGVHTAMEVYREYALAVKLKGNLPAGGVYWHQHEKQMYSVRPYSNEKGNFLLVLDASKMVGHEKHTEESFKKVEEYLRKHFEVDKIEYTWAAQNYQPADGLAYIGTSPLENHTYIATGFAADGLVYGTLAGMIISDAIVGKENKWAKLYDPKRFTPVASAKKWLEENMHVAKHLVKDYLFKGDEKGFEGIASGEGKIVELNGEKVAAYRNEKGQLQILSAACTHMGCVVHWNNGEKSWDCPCHGSRFSIDGEVLEGPAYANLANKGSLPKSQMEQSLNQTGNKKKEGEG